MKTSDNNCKQENNSPKVADISSKLTTKNITLASGLVVKVVIGTSSFISEKTMTNRENRIPQLAADAVKQARANTLKSGRSVIEVKDSHLVETLPDGSVNVIRSLTPPTKVTPGQKLVRKIK